MLHTKTINIYIDRIDDMISKIEKYTKDINSYEDFIKDEESIDSTVFCLLQIGETAGQMSKLYPDIAEFPYSKIIGMRNILVHAYHSIDLEIIRKTIQHQIPKLKIWIQNHNNTTISIKS
jgi:uncharacterized protein with HEPN domain